MHMRRLPCTLMTFMFLMLFGGCATTPASPSADAHPAAATSSNPRPMEPQPRRRPANFTAEIIGASVQDRPIHAVTFGDRGPAILIIATIHGDEAAGTPLLTPLVRHLHAHSDLYAQRRIVLIPCANPDGMAADTRGNVNGIDLNRNFPADNFKTTHRHGDAPLSEPEARALHDFIRRIQPVRIASIHQPLRCIDYDGPGSTLAAAMADVCDLPVRKLGARPGSLGAYVGETLGIPIITIELPGPASQHSPRELWNRYGEMLLAFITFEHETHID
jgi:protein MpaA